MVLEVAQFDITPGAEPAFREAYAAARELIVSAPGCRSARMTQGVETPTRFVLLVEWDSVQHHEDFRSSDAFPQWRGHIGPHFATPPFVEHYADL